MPAASPCSSSCGTAASISPSCRTHRQPGREGRADAERRCSGCDLVPLDGAADEGGGGPREGRDAAGLDRRRVLTLAAYLGSSYVDQFNKFGRVFQVYVQADPQFRLRPRGHRAASVRNKRGRHDPARHHGGDHADGRAVAAEPPTTSIRRRPCWGCRRPGFSSGEAMALMEQIAQGRCRRSGYEWTAMSYQEKLVGNQI